MTELDESIFNILKYGGGKIITNDDELRVQIPRYINSKDYSQMIKNKNELITDLYVIMTQLHCHIQINTDYTTDILPFVIKMRKYANGIIESDQNFTYYILDKSKIDWVKIDDIFDKLLGAKEYKIISKDTYDFIVCKLLYRIDINEFNIK